MRNMTTEYKHDAGPGKSVAVKATAAKDATLKVGVQAKLYDCEEARISVQGSVSGAADGWFDIAELTITAGSSGLAVFETDIPVNFMRVSLLDDIVSTSPRPQAPTPTETIEIDEAPDGGSYVRTTIVTAPPPPSTPYGISSWMSAC
jgi:hypothetical protein